MSRKTFFLFYVKHKQQPVSDCTMVILTALHTDPRQPQQGLSSLGQVSRQKTKDPSYGRVVNLTLCPSVCLQAAVWQALNHYAYLDAVFLAERLYAEGNVHLSEVVPVPVRGVRTSAYYLDK